ncbi:ENR1 protein, partial [Quiscalus mexicanus]|nr:ENR1 protein [Quiscalus mexicanus]
LLVSNRNLFIDLIQEIATELGLSNYWTCGGPKSAKKWPWKAESLTPDQLLKWDNAQISRTIQRPEGWVLDQRIIGKICISREGKEYTEIVGYTPCISTLAVNSNNNSNVWQPEPPAGYWSHEKGTNCKW